MLDSLFSAFSGGKHPVTTQLLLRALPAEHKVAQHLAIPYLLFQISCESGVDIGAPMAVALELIRQPGCQREATISTLMFVTFAGINGSDSEQLRDKVADQLLRRLGSRVRLLRGTLAGVIGHIGRGNNYVNGAAFVGVETLCAALFRQRYGTIDSLDLIPKERGQSEMAAH